MAKAVAICAASWPDPPIWKIALPCFRSVRTFSSVLRAVTISR